MSQTGKRVKWLGKQVCDICCEEVGDTLYDAKLGQGSWGVLCEHDFNEFGCKLGTGLGQKYVRQENGDYIKVEG